MTPLLTAQDIAEILRTSPAVARSIMKERHQTPLDLGTGKSRGYRWTQGQLEKILGNAKPQPKNTTSKSTGFFSGTRRDALGF